MKLKPINTIGGICLSAITFGPYAANAEIPGLKELLAKTDKSYFDPFFVGNNATAAFEGLYEKVLKNYKRDGIFYGCSMDQIIQRKGYSVNAVQSYFETEFTKALDKVTSDTAKGNSACKNEVSRIHSFLMETAKKDSYVRDCLFQEQAIHELCKDAGSFLEIKKEDNKKKVSFCGEPIWEIFHITNSHITTYASLLRIKDDYKEKLLDEKLVKEYAKLINYAKDEYTYDANKYSYVPKMINKLLLYTPNLDVDTTVFQLIQEKERGLLNEVYRKHTDKKYKEEKEREFLRDLIGEKANQLTSTQVHNACVKIYGDADKDKSLTDKLWEVKFSDEEKSRLFLNQSVRYNKDRLIKKEKEEMYSKYLSTKFKALIEEVSSIPQIQKVEKDANKEMDGLMSEAEKIMREYLENVDELTEEAEGRAVEMAMEKLGLSEDK